jgi:uncharacterized protein YxeA
MKIIIIIIIIIIILWIKAFIETTTKYNYTVKTGIQIQQGIHPTTQATHNKDLNSNKQINHYNHRRLRMKTKPCRLKTTTKNFSRLCRK